MDERDSMNGFARLRTLAAPLVLALGIATPWPAARAADAGKADARSNRDSGARQITPPGRSLRAAKSGAAQKPTTGSYWQTLLVLGGIIVVIVVGAKLLRKHGPLLNGGIPDDAFEVLGKRAIDRGQLVYLVRLGSRILIIGSSTNGLQTLGEVTDPVEIDFLAGVCRQSTERSPITQGFLTLFNRSFGRSEPAGELVPHDRGQETDAHSEHGLSPSVPDREQVHV